MASAEDRPANLQQEVGRQQPCDDPEQEAYLSIALTHAVLSEPFARLFKSYGLSDPQYNALRIVASAGCQGIRSEQIAAHMIARDPDTTRLIDRLQQSGLVQRHRLSSDRRCVSVQITDKGTQLLAELHEKVLALHREQLRHLDRGQLDELIRLLFRARHPDASPAPTPPVEH